MKRPMLDTERVWLTRRRICGMENRRAFRLPRAMLGEERDIPGDPPWQRTLASGLAGQGRRTRLPAWSGEGWKTQESEDVPE